MTATASELTWLKKILKDIGMGNNQPIKIICDNNLARHIASHLVFSESTKHIEVDCHFKREKVQSKEMETIYLSSKDQLANNFTKALDSSSFQSIGHKLGSIDLYDPSLRGVLKIYNRTNMRDATLWEA